MRIDRAWLLVPALVAVAALGGSARADGDPASDVLLVSNVYVPTPAPASTPALAAAVQAVSDKGERVKAAVIATETDLGSVPSLFGKVQDYADFLALELEFLYTGPLLVVMPGGYGFADPSSPGQAATGTSTLAGLAAPPADADGLVRAAAAAVGALDRAGVLAYRDTTKPTFIPKPARGRAGKVLTLTFQLWDDSFRAGAKLDLDDAQGHVLKRFQRPLGSVSQFADYRVAWKVPARPKRRVLAFCGSSFDAAGNRSRRSCAKVTIG